jgi:hypothetical protein
MGDAQALPVVLRPTRDVSGRMSARDRQIGRTFDERSRRTAWHVRLEATSDLRENQQLRACRRDGVIDDSGNVDSLGDAVLGKRPGLDL